MRNLLADFFLSLDGFASDAKGGQEWIGAFFGPQATDFVQETLSQPQVMIMGRKTYQVLSRYWPTATVPQAGPMNSLPKLVFSKTLKGPLGWSNTRLAKSALAEEIIRLKNQPGPDLRSIGSLELVRNMIELNLVDRLRLMIFPAVLGKTGTEPLFKGYEQIRLELVGQKVLDSNTLLLEYRPATRTAGR